MIYIEITTFFDLIVEHTLYKRKYVTLVLVVLIIIKTVLTCKLTKNANHDPKIVVYSVEWKQTFFGGVRDIYVLEEGI